MRGFTSALAILNRNIGLPLLQNEQIMRTVFNKYCAFDHINKTIKKAEHKHEKQVTLDMMNEE